MEQSDEYPENVLKRISLLSHLRDAILNGYKFSRRRFSRKSSLMIDEFAYQISPVVDTLIDSIIDQLFLLGELFKEGAPGVDSNPDLIFRDDTERILKHTVQPKESIRSGIAIDEFRQLGSPAGVQGQKSLRIPAPKKYYWDPQAEFYFGELIKSFIRLKDPKKSIKSIFMTLFDRLGLNPPSISKKTLKERKKAAYFWWRRQERRYNAVES